MILNGILSVLLPADQRWLNKVHGHLGRAWPSGNNVIRKSRVPLFTSARIKYMITLSKCHFSLGVSSRRSGLRMSYMGYMVDIGIRMDPGTLI